MAPAPQPVIPVVLDKNTAMYSLHLYGGIGEEFELIYPAVGPIRFRVAGLLSNSILQGSLLIGEADFVRRFPEVSGYRYFLIKSPAGRLQEVASALEDRLGDQGFDAVSARERLQDLLAVQNTYLSTFQSLGALGLLLGTFGLAAVQMRNVIERRGELALLRAAGFRRRRLARLVMIESLALLAGGLSTGCLAALVTTLPHMLVGGASIPLGDLTVLLAVVLAVGCLTSLASVRTVLRAPLMAALREE
jgi:ABC-type antimicrobial peptide transport system permease subunit